MIFSLSLLAQDWNQIVKTVVSDRTDGDYKTWDGAEGDLTDGIVTNSQRFFVQVNFAGNLTFAAFARVHRSFDLNK